MSLNSISKTENNIEKLALLLRNRVENVRNDRNDNGLKIGHLKSLNKLRH